MENIDNVNFIIVWPDPTKTYLKVSTGLEDEDYDYIDTDVIISFVTENLGDYGLKKLKSFIKFYGTPFIVIPKKGIIKQLTLKEIDENIKSFLLPEEVHEQKLIDIKSNLQKFTELFRK